MICRTRKELLDARPRRAFISYAQVEASWKTQLIEALEPLKSVGVEMWHDGMLLPGDPWHPKILSALADADLVILLVSRTFLESQYARETEVPLAVERADAGRSRLVPIILDSCDWAKQPFAKYQALPGDRVPIAERSDVVHALNDCLERLRWVFDPAEAKYGGGAPGKGVRGLPLLRVTFDFAGSNWPDWSALLERARMIANNGDVRTNAARRITGASTGNRWEWLLEGPQQAFATIETAHQERRLAGALGVGVVSVDRTVGAVYYAGTYLTNEGEAPPPVDRTLTVGSLMSPPVLFGLAVRPSEPDYLQPFCAKNGNDIGYDDWQREKQKLLSYFNTVLALPDDLRVNLSAFESGRVMPANLARTEVGRLLGQQDCLLKQLTASMLHPRNPQGRAFWERVEALLARRLGKRESIEIWQKVWIVPGEATLNQKSAGYPYEHPLPPGIEVRREDWFGHLSNCSMRVMCETDYLALEKRSEEARLIAGPDDPFHEQALEVFREIILPSLVDEVNNGSHFAPLRQVHYAVALAKWYREEIAGHGFHTRLMELAEQTRTSLGNAAEIGPGPDAPEWMNECYARYLGLLDGVFRAVQPKPDEEGTNRLRVYYSGCVSFKERIR